MNKKTLTLVIIVIVVVLAGVLAFIKYKDDSGHWCAPGTHWGLGYNADGLSDAQIESQSRCLDNNSIY